ncbi:MAG: chemotaxis protein CheB [Candidatus Cloacimonetes bacterium]|nr:chemotaxis protein CheB [Candidatus Cloacimonadota bacterium]
MFKKKLKLDLSNFKFMVIGVSAGGMEALSKLLPSFPKNFPLPIVIIQHLHKNCTGYYIEYYNEKCALFVKEAKHYEKIEAGNIYFAPPDYHLLIEENKTLSLTIDEKVNYSRPSIDVLFESAAEVFQEKLIGIILTGANSDGTEGMKIIKQNGGLTIAQNPLEAEFPIMPQSAIDSGSIDLILTLQEMTIEFSRWNNKEKK